MGNLTIEEKNPKIKQSTLSNSYEDGCLKDVGVFTKVTSLQCSWIKDYMTKISMNGKSFLYTSSRQSFAKTSNFTCVLIVV